MENMFSENRHDLFDTTGKLTGWDLLRELKKCVYVSIFLWKLTWSLECFNSLKLARDTLEPIARKAREREIVEEILERDKNITAERFHRAAKQRVYRVIDRWMHGHPSLCAGRRYTYGSGNRLGGENGRRGGRKKGRSTGVKGERFGG